MDQIELAIEHLTLQDTKNISATAKLFNVDRSTLSRRWNGVTNRALVSHKNSRFLNDAQEKELIKYINKLTEKGIPLTVLIVRNFASNIASKLPRKY
jgi:transposase-like protein